MKKISHITQDGIEKKYCNKCRAFKPLRCFGRNRRSWDGLLLICRNCTKEADAKRYVANPGKAKQFANRWRQANLKKIREIEKRYSLKWRIENPEKAKESSRKSHAKCYAANPEKAKEKRDKWKGANLEKWREIQRKSSTKKRSTLKGRLNGNISSAIGGSLKENKAGRHWEDLVGYSLEDLIKYLKRTIPEGYTWADYMASKFHIDHVIPISVFNFKKPEDDDFKRCWALSNLQLLPAIENMKKSNKLNKHFQPSLIF